MLETVDEVIDALGGTSATAKILGFKPTRVSNWRAAGRFPADTFVALTEALERVGKKATRSLWNMRKLKEAAE
jgi:DNA-binding transcriptional regulator YdaS (Cro superfamily)